MQKNFVFKKLNAVLNLLSHKANQSYNVTETTTEVLYDLTDIPDDYTGIQAMYNYAQDVNANVISHESRVGKFESRFSFSEQLDSNGDVEAYVYRLLPTTPPPAVATPVPLDPILAGVNANGLASGSTIFWNGSSWAAQAPASSDYVSIDTSGLTVGTTLYWDGHEWVSSDLIIENI